MGRICSRMPGCTVVLALVLAHAIIVSRAAGRRGRPRRDRSAARPARLAWGVYFRKRCGLAGQLLLAWGLRHTMDRQLPDESIGPRWARAVVVVNLLCLYAAVGAADGSSRRSDRRGRALGACSSSCSRRSSQLPARSEPARRAARSLLRTTGRCPRCATGTSPRATSSLLSSRGSGRGQDYLRAARSIHPLPCPRLRRHSVIIACDLRFVSRITLEIAALIASAVR